MLIRKYFSPLVATPPEFRVGGIALREMMPPMIVHRPRGLRRYFFFFAHTPMTLGTRAQPLECAAQTLFVYAPGVEHWYGRKASVWNHSWIGLGGAFVERQLLESKLPLNSPIHLDATIADYYYAGLYRELSEHALPNASILQNLFQNFIAEIGRACAGETLRVRIPPRYRQLKQYLDESYDRKLTLEMLAARVHVSRWHLCREFKRYFGLGPMEYLQNTRMQQAAGLLRDRTLNVSEVARLCGYEDLFHFSKLFKKYYGASPRTMRNSL